MAAVAKVYENEGIREIFKIVHLLLICLLTGVVTEQEMREILHIYKVIIERKCQNLNRIEGCKRPGNKSVSVEWLGFL